MEKYSLDEEDWYMMHLSDNPFYKLLKTGETTQYGGYADDGFYEMGVAKEYDVLTLGVYSGHTHIILNAKDEPHDNACVYDRRTNLMWSRYLPHLIGPGNDGMLPFTTNVNGEGIFTYVAAANAALLAGYGDWRIPNAYELLSLADYEQPTGVPDVVAFPGWTLEHVWTSSTYTAANTYAYEIYFYLSVLGVTLKTINTLFCSLVRGG